MNATEVVAGKSLCAFTPTKKGKALGYFVYHTQNNKPIPDEQQDALFEHVLGPANEAITRSLQAQPSQAS